MLRMLNFLTIFEFLPRVSLSKYKTLSINNKCHVHVQGDTSPGEPGLGLTLISAVPPSASADGKLAELAEQVGKMVEHPKSQSTPTQVRQEMCRPVYSISCIRKALRILFTTIVYNFGCMQPRHIWKLPHIEHFHRKIILRSVWEKLQYMCTATCCAKISTETGFFQEGAKELSVEALHAWKLPKQYGTICIRNIP